MLSRDGVVFEGMADFDARVLPRLGENRFFRLAPDAEIDASYEAYRAGAPGRLVEVWRAVAEPTRAILPPVNARAFAGARFAPRIVNGLSFVAIVRAALAAGVRFRDRLRPEVRDALAAGLPWLARRHEHVPEGWAPPCEFPPAIDPFFDPGSGADVVDAQARFQIVAALSEVMQCVYTRHLAVLLDVPILTRHAVREEAMAESYLAHWSPPATRALFRQCLLVLDAINAAVFECCCDTHLFPLLSWSMAGGLRRRGEWRRFVDGLETPPWLLPVPA